MIGINSMVVPPRLALAVPSASVIRFLAPGRRARLGVRTQRVALPPPLVRRLGLPQENALIVVEVCPARPAAAAGLLPGDVLLAAGGVLLDSPVALAEQRRRRRGGAPRACTSCEAGAVRLVDVTPTERGVIDVLVVAAYPMVRAGLRALLEEAADCAVVGQAASFAEAAALAARLAPDVALVDAGTARGHELDELAALADEQPSLGLVVLAEAGAERYPAPAGARARGLSDA